MGSKTSLAAQLAAARRRERESGPATIESVVALLGEGSRVVLEKIQATTSHAADSAIANHALTLSRQWDINYEMAHDVCLWLASRHGIVVSAEHGRLMAKRARGGRRRTGRDKRKR